MAFGVYVHIPYCLQRCVYCDFATFEVNDSRVGPQAEYVDLVCREIRLRHRGVLKNFPTIDTLYFGGGTPSLLEPESILAIKTQLSQCGFNFSTQLEWTIEINPATINPAKLQNYLHMGINRFSLGVQSFSDEHLKIAGRRHSAQQTRETLQLLKGLNLNMDLLFALPHQSKAQLEADLDEFLKWRPNHISPYCLTVPTSNPMASNRPEDDVQVEMFSLIREKLTRAGYSQYEISNYCLPGFHSRHNDLYWNDDSYWGVGLSSHSFIKSQNFGLRFWNPSQYASYKKQLEGNEVFWPYDHLPSPQIEKLRFHEALTDFCHTALRTRRGLNTKSVENKFSPEARHWLDSRLNQLSNDWIRKEGESWAITHEGQLLSNRIFESVLMTESDYIKLQKPSMF